MTPEKLARKFHNTYERLAPEYGYETRKDTKNFNPKSKNGRLMVAVCDEILTYIFGRYNQHHSRCPKEDIHPHDLDGQESF